MRLLSKHLLLLLVLGTFLYFACKREPVPTLPEKTQIVITPDGDTIYITNTDTMVREKKACMFGVTTQQIHTRNNRNTRFPCRKYRGNN
jgi:DNA-binding beta-propeller fold protein YncE